MEYRYTECGLDNVVIEGMPDMIDDRGETTYRIENINGLHRVIAYAIVMHEHAISGNELRFLRTEMGLTQAELARVVHCDAQTVGRWERGETPLDPKAETLIRLHAVEKLDLEEFESVEDAARRCVPSAQIEIIRIDGRDPKNYRQAA
jgi:transcriptional regulator with XRE-family HTH domain